MNLSQNIKRLRKSHGYTQKDLASILKVKPTSISAWESGRNKPLMDKITIMSTLFGVSTSELVGAQILQKRLMCTKMCTKISFYTVFQRFAKNKNRFISTF